MADFKISLNLVANDNASATVRQISANLKKFARETATSQAREATAGARKANQQLTQIAKQYASQSKREAVSEAKAKAKAVADAERNAARALAKQTRDRERALRRGRVTSADMGALATNMEGVGRIARRALATPITLAMDFEAELNNINAQSGGAFGLDGTLDKLGKRARELGRSTEFTATEVAAAFATMTQAGFTYEQQLASVPIVLDTATVAGVSMAQAALLTANTLGQFKMPADQAERAMSVITRASQASQIGIMDLGASFKHFGPVAHQFGTDIEGAATLIAVLGKSGIAAGPAGTGARAFLTRVSRMGSDKFRTKPQAAAMEVLGIDGKQMKEAADSGDVDRTVRFFSDSFTKSKASRSEKIAALQALMQERSGTIGSILSESIVSGEWDKVASATRSTSTVGDMAAIKRSGSKAKVKELSGALEELGITIGEKLLPQLNPLLIKATEATVKMAEWANKNPRLISQLARVAVVLGVAGPILGGFVRTAQTLAILSKLSGWTGAFNTALASTGPKAETAAAGVTTLNKAHAALGAFAAGYALGSLADQYLGISDAVAGVNRRVSTFQGLLGFNKRSPTAVLGDLSEEDRAELTASKERMAALVAEKEGLMPAMSSPFAEKRHEMVDAKILAEKNRQDAINNRAVKRNKEAAAVEKFGRASMGQINEAALAGHEAAGGAAGAVPTLRQLVGIRLKVDQEGRVTKAILDESGLDAGLIVEGL